MDIERNDIHDRLDVVSGSGPIWWSTKLAIALARAAVYTSIDASLLGYKTLWFFATNIPLF